MSFSVTCQRLGLFDSIEIDAPESHARSVAMNPLAATPVAAAVAGVLVASAALGVAAGEAVD